MKSEVQILTVIVQRRRSLPESHITALFTRLGDNLFRLEDGFLCGPINFGEVIEALPTDDKDTFIFTRRIRRAGLKRNCFMIPHSMVDKPCFLELARQIEALGGFSAVDFGGVFLVLLPKDCSLDVTAELDKGCCVK